MPLRIELLLLLCHGWRETLKFNPLLLCCQVPFSDNFRRGRDTSVLHDDLAVWAHLLHAGAIARLEFVDERNVHSAHESDLLGVTDECRQRADEVRPFFLAKFERRNIRRWRDHVAIRIGRQRLVDARERRVRILLREIGEIVGEDESDANHQVHPFGSE